MSFGRIQPRHEPEADCRHLDLAHLRRQAMGNEALMREVLGLYIDHARDCLAMLEQAAGGKPWRDAAHALKGTARNIGAFEVGRAAEEAERLGPEPAPEARAAALARLRALCILAEEQAARFIAML
jgi:HPt (histidine-containing phosphotransfer) domain-containing protein